VFGRPHNKIVASKKFAGENDLVPLNSQTLRSFVAVTEEQSYTRAATGLHLSQPTVYQHVRQLEQELGTKLVEQHGKRVVLTDHGRVVYQYARRARDEEEDLVRYIRDDASLDRGQLRVVAGTTSAEFILPTIAVAFRKLHPGIEIGITAAGTTEEVDEAVLDRTYDLGMHSNPMTRPGLLKQHFLTDDLLGLARVEHRFVSEGRPVTPRQLITEPVVHFGTGAVRLRPAATIQALVNEWFAQGGVEPVTPIRMGTLQGMKRAIRDGAGVGLVSSYAIEPEDPVLRTFPLARPPRRDFILVSREHGWESNVVRAFREFALGMAWAEGDARAFRRAPKMED
jgi:DNA-binding transcriptional LysR family regulator